MDKTIIIWNMSSYRLISTLAYHTDWVILIIKSNYKFIINNHNRLIV
jgi:WD40 repeat protein